MSPHGDRLRERLPKIAAKAVSAAGCEEWRAEAEALIAATVEAVETGVPLKDEALAPVPATNGSRERMLRAVEARCLDCLYEEDDSEATRAYAVALRDKFRPLYPRENGGTGFSFLAELDNPAAPSGGPEHAQLRKVMTTVLSNAVEMVYIHDEAGVLRYVNERCVQVTGFSREELLAPMTIHDFLPPEYTDMIADRLATLGAGAQSPFTLEIYNRWGQRVPLEFTLQHLPLELSAGQPQDFVLVCAHDCHLSRRLERRIEAMDDLESRVLHELPVGVIVTNPDLLITEVNPSALGSLGAACREDVLGAPVHELGQEEDRALRAKLMSVLKSGKEWRSEWHGHTRFGRELHSELIVLPLGGEVGGLIIMLRDIHHEIGRNHALVQSQKLQALGTTIAGVSHELNNPLTGIVGYTQLLLASDIAPSVRARVDHIAMEARRAQRIVQNLLTFAQRHETRKTLHDVNAVVQNVLSLQEYQLRVDGITLTVDLAPDLPETLIDVNALQTVCLHIVNNAHQALIESDKEEKALKVRSFVDNDLIHLEFEDTGPGISKSDQPRIFDPFFTTREPGAGPGLGLSVSYGIVQDHGGQILLSSAEGRGSTFTILLPIREESTAEPLVREP